jgi:D-alanyl-D-alanine carboxypeptidase
MSRQVIRSFVLTIMLVFAGVTAYAAPFAAMVIDARTGEVLYANNADTQLYPASLTKMMTLYITFEAIKNGEIGEDTLVTISPRAAAEPPSKLGLKAGQKIRLRYLIRAAAVKSANDAATAIAEAIEGSEAAFARRMNKTAKALGMTRTVFKNAHGLTEEGHKSTARDMTTLGRHLFYDYNQYYHLFSRRTVDAGGKELRNTNRKFLDAYRGADGIKTGYTQAAGFNLVASAERGDVRIIATVFGGRSTTARNEKVAELLDLGFKKAPSYVAERPPSEPQYDKPKPKTIRLVAAVITSPRPQHRPDGLATGEVEVLLVAEGSSEEDEDEIEEVADVVEVDDGGVVSSVRPEPRVEEPRVVARVSTSGGSNWGIHLGAFTTRSDAEKLLLQTALQDLSSLDGALRKVVQRGGKYQANFVGLTEEHAKRACDRLRARRQDCLPVAPGS